MKRDFNRSSQSSTQSPTSSTTNPRKRMLFGRAKRIKKKSSEFDPLNMIANFLNHHLLSDTYLERSRVMEAFTEDCKLSSEWKTFDDVQFDVDQFLKQHSSMPNQFFCDLISFSKDEFEKQRRREEKKKISEIRKRKRAPFESIYAIQSPGKEIRQQFAPKPISYGYINMNFDSFDEDLTIIGKSNALFEDEELISKNESYSFQKFFGIEQATEQQTSSAHLNSPDISQLQSPIQSPIKSSLRSTIQSPSQSNRETVTSPMRSVMTSPMRSPLRSHSKKINIFNNSNPVEEEPDLKKFNYLEQNPIKHSQDSQNTLHKQYIQQTQDQNQNMIEDSDDEVIIEKETPILDRKRKRLEMSPIYFTRESPEKRRRLSMR